MRKGALALLIVVCGIATLAAAGEPEGVVGLTRDEALKLGEMMYRRGVLPSGEPMRALVQEDIEVDGTMFSCESCHLRSGMGSIEGTVVTLPTCGSWLYKPLVGREMKRQSEERLPHWLNPPPFRKAYTDRLVARAIWAGKDPDDRELSWVMPRYKMSTRDMEILVYYLKNLSSEFSPGVDGKTLKFATVIGDDVSPEDREAMLGPLEVIVNDHNGQMRHEERRARHGPFNMEERYSFYRRFSLAVWELRGPRDTWPAQLEEHYRREPVFALLGGISGGDWTPIHRFCERNKIPCIFPITDYPAISASDWYTLYFSKGYYQEGAAAARFLRRRQDLARNIPVVQVYRAGPAGREAARGFREARVTMELAPPVDVELAQDQPLGEPFWGRLVAEHAGAVVVLWLAGGDLDGVERLGEEPRPPLVMASATLLGDAPSVLPAAIRDIAYVTHPLSFPKDEERSRLVTRRWLQSKGLPVTNFEIQSKMYFLGWMLAGMVKSMRDDFYRDYFLERVDMMRDQYYSIAVYPRLSFGPGQRYASKGCYVARVADGDPPALEAASEWVIH